MKLTKVRPRKSESVPIVAELGGLAVTFRQTRINLGFDMATVAQEASVSLETVHRLESEPELVPLQDLYAVSNVLNLDPGVVLSLLHSAMR